MSVDESKLTDAMLRAWVRDNLRLDVTFADPMGPLSDVVVSLMLVGEAEPISSERISIPGGSSA